MVWNIAICDDDICFTEKMLKICRKRADRENIEANFFIFYNGEDLLASNQRFHLIFLDVELPGMDGFEVGKAIVESENQVKLVYLTSHDEWVQRGFEVAAYRYVYKTQMDQIPLILEKAICEIKHQQKDMVIIQTREQNICFFYGREIYAIESIGDEAVIMLKDNNVITKETVQDLLERLGDRFVLCSRGKAVNLENVKLISKGKVVLRNGIEYDVARRREKIVNKLFFDFLEKKAQIQ